MSREESATGSASGFQLSRMPQIYGIKLPCLADSETCAAGVVDLRCDYKSTVSRFCLRIMSEYQVD